MTQLNNKIKFDLEERTAKFGEEVIRFCKKVPRNPINDPLINQLIKAATSVGANYCEADDAESKLDFRHKIGICKKEARETKHFLRLISVAQENLKANSQLLWEEARQLHLIFNTIYKKVT